MGKVSAYFCYATTNACTMERVGEGPGLLLLLPDVRISGNR